MLIRNIALGIICIVVIAACSPYPHDMKVSSRVRSPDGQREAVELEDMTGGATVATTTNIYVTSPGLTPRRDERVFSQEGVCHLVLHWLSKSELQINYYAKKAGAVTQAPKGALYNVQVHWLGRDAESGC